MVTPWLRLLPLECFHLLALPLLDRLLSVALVPPVVLVPVALLSRLPLRVLPPVATLPLSPLPLSPRSPRDLRHLPTA